MIQVIQVIQVIQLIQLIQLIQVIQAIQVIQVIHDNVIIITATVDISLWKRIQNFTENLML